MNYIFYKPKYKKSLKDILQMSKMYDNRVSFIRYKGWLAIFVKKDVVLMNGLHKFYADHNTIQTQLINNLDRQNQQLAKPLKDKDIYKFGNLIVNHYYDKTRDKNIHRLNILNRIIELNDALYT